MDQHPEKNNKRKLRPSKAGTTDKAGTPAKGAASKKATSKSSDSSESVSKANKRKRTGTASTVPDPVVNEVKSSTGGIKETIHLDAKDLEDYSLSADAKNTIKGWKNGKLVILDTLHGDPASGEFRQKYYNLIEQRVRAWDGEKWVDDDKPFFDKPVGMHEPNKPEADQPADEPEDDLDDEVNAGPKPLKRGFPKIAGTKIFFYFLAGVAVLSLISGILRGCKGNNPIADKELKEAEVLKQELKRSQVIIDSMSKELKEDSASFQAIQDAVDARQESLQATKEREATDREGESIRKQTKIDKDETIQKIKSVATDADRLRIIDEQLRLQSTVR